MLRVPETIDARRRPRAIGLPLEQTWACSECLDNGRYRRPPDGWDGQPQDWPARTVFMFSDDQLLAFANALNGVLNGPDAIEDWEFSTRLGVTRDVARRTLRALHGHNHGEEAP